MRCSPKSYFGRKVKLDFRIGFTGKEQALRDAFAIVHARLGLKIRDSQAGFPDYKLEDGSGKEISAEAEHRATQFNHDEEKCDLLICWVDDWSDCPIPKLVVSRYAQERPRFEGFAGGVPPKVRLLLGSPKRLSEMLNNFKDIGDDVMDLLLLDCPAGLSGFDSRALGQNPSIAGIKQGDRYYAELFWFYREGWDLDASCLWLSVDFDDELFEVRADIGEKVVEKCGASVWEDILSNVRGEGYIVNVEPKTAHDSSIAADAGGSTELLRAIGERRVSSIRFIRRLKFREVFLGDPYDVVIGLHDELYWILNLMDELGLCLKTKNR